MVSWKIRPRHQCRGAIIPDAADLLPHLASRDTCYCSYNELVKCYAWRDLDYCIDLLRLQRKTRVRRTGDAYEA